MGTLALALAVSGQALAQDAPPPQSPAPSPTEAVSTPAAPAPASAPAGSQHCPAPATDADSCIPALTPVRVAIKAHLGSKISLTDQTFPIELVQPIVVDGRELVPAGATGMGEVVHAKKSGGSGASGELVLAARYLEIGGRRLRLRSLNFAVAGEDKTRTVNTIAIASAATMPALSLIGFFIQGKGIDIPEGTEASAKTAEPFVLDPPVITPVAESTPAPATGPVSQPQQQGDSNAPS